MFRVSSAYSKALRSCGLKPSSHLPGHVGEWPCVSAGPQNLPPFFMWFCSFSLHSQLRPTDSPKVPPVLLYMRWASLYGIRYILFLGKSCPSAQDSSEQTSSWSSCTNQWQFYQSCRSGKYPAIIIIQDSFSHTP